MRNSRHAEERGAALIVAIAVMTILLAISLTFFTVSRLELKTATNVENTVKAELLANAATNIAISFLNHDLFIHPTFTSLDHAWHTYFNGAWVAGKPWAFQDMNGDGVGDTWRAYRNALLDIPYTLPGGEPGDLGLIGHIYVPREEDPIGPVVDPYEYLQDPETYRFVVDPGYDTSRFTAAQIDTWADVDNDQDGYRDSMWIPLVADTFHGNVMTVSKDPSIPSELIELGDRIDNDLDLELYDLPAYADPALRQILGDDSIEEINETAPFLYYGGSDGLDNDGDGEIDEDDERWAAAMGLDIPRFFLTAPLNAADGTYLVLQNVPILDAASEVFRYVNIDCSPDGGWVDLIDNDFDLITNKHTEYYTKADGTSVTDPDNRILSEEEFNGLRGVYEISPRYLADSIRQNWRIKSTGEPVCELVGRAAILVTDEAGKVNINVAGGHSLDVPRLVRLENQGDLIDLADLADGSSGELTGWWRAALGQGLGPQEYYTQMLPRMGAARARKLWHYLTGAPNGSQALGPLEDLTGPPEIEAEFVADSVLPGYGFVDDNGNALLLAMNGIDDDGDGLIDEGINDGSDLSPEAIDKAWDYAEENGIRPDLRPFRGARAQEVYRLHLGQLLEGVDEPGEFRQRRPHRNAVAEGKERMSDGITFDENDNDLDGVSNEVGEMADRVFRTRQELKRIVRNEGSGEFRTNANTFFERLRNFVTLHSVDASNRYQEATRMESALAPAFDLYPMLKSPVNLKLNYAYARGDEVAEALQEGWDLRSPTPEYSGGGEIGFAAGLQQEGVTLALDPPVPYEVPSFIDQESGFTVHLGWQYFRSPVHFLERCPPEETCAWRPAQDNRGNLVPYYADPGLRALRLGATLRDFADTDYARTELTMAVDEDVWWSAMLDEAGEAPEIRPIHYTVSGFEGVRITEMMVRPVRRVEAEMNRLYMGEYAFLNPNLPDVFNPDSQPFFATEGFRVQVDTMERFIAATHPDAEFQDRPPTGYWPPPYGGTVQQNPQNPGVGYPGSGTVMLTRSKTIEALMDLGGPVPEPVTWPNIIEFSFAPSPGLPPGRYYLTINTVSSLYADAAPDHRAEPTVLRPEDIMVATKYVRHNGDMTPMAIRPELGLDSPVMSVGAEYILWDVDQFLAAGHTLDQFYSGTFGRWQHGNTDARHAVYVGGYGYGFSDVVHPEAAVDAVERTGWVFVPSGDNGLDGGELEGYGQDLIPHRIGLGYDPAPMPQPTYTVMVPPYAEDPAEQVYLHVAICMHRDYPHEADPEFRPLCLNFFDFSQEPDHEWIEIQNVSGREIDISGWELVVGGVGDTDSRDGVQMRIPEGLTADPFLPVILGAYPPDNRLVLAVNARDAFEHADQMLDDLSYLHLGLDSQRQNLLDMNGIGLVGADLTGGPNADDLDYYGVTFPAMPWRDPGHGYVQPGADGRGERIDYRPDIPGYIAYVFEDPDYQRRIVELEYIDATGDGADIAPLGSLDRGDPQYLAYWVLRGGVFPNRPEHDGVDNDGDGGDPILLTRGLLEQDGVDNDGDGEIDEFYEGVDEGRWRMDHKFMYVGPQPGAFSAFPVHYYFDPTYSGSDYHDYFNYEEASAGNNSSFIESMFYLSDPTSAPEWKEFVERRFFPGDNVVVTLYDVTPIEKEVDDGMGGIVHVTEMYSRGVVDRITYSERDVINRAIDDGEDVYFEEYTGGLPARPALSGGSDFYQTFWPDNTMGLDFYRTLERKHHPLYNGDRFGTQNRWQATDGNYDDWSHDPVPHPPEYQPGQAWPAEKWFGSPLKTNAAAEMWRGDWWIDPDYIGLEDLDPSDADDARILSLKLAEAEMRHLNRRPSSVGDVLTLPYFSLTKTHVYFEDRGEFGDDDPLGVYGTARLGRVSMDGLLVGHSYPDAQGDVPESRRRDLRALVGAGSMSAVTMACGQAEFRVVGVDPGLFDHDDVRWRPQEWGPVFLYRLGNGDVDDFTYWVSFEETDTGPLQQFAFLFDFDASALPSGVLPDDLLSRWPIERRAALYASTNLDGFEQDIDSRQGEDDERAAAEALFVWTSEDGLEDGEYNLYIDTGGRLDQLRLADRVMYERAEGTTGWPPRDYERGLLTPLGRDVCAMADNNTCLEELLLDVEVFTDRDGDGRCWQNLNSDGALQWSEFERGADGDSFGAQHGLTPDWDGYIHYGIVRIENNYLAVLVRNWARNEQLNRFAGVVLTPRDREPGRINLNTVVTRAYPDRSTSSGIQHKGFNALMGVPGILRETEQERPADDLPPPDVGLPGVEPVMPLLPVMNGGTDPLGRAQLVEVSRPSHWDARYYVFLSDLITDEANSLGTYPLSTWSDDWPRLQEVTWRFSQAANLLTTRSDVFEILVTVQAGYGIDVEGLAAGGADGRIDYRSSTEFIVTAEKKTRTIYER